MLLAGHPSVLKLTLFTLFPKHKGTSAFRSAAGTLKMQYWKECRRKAVVLRQIFVNRVVVFPALLLVPWRFPVLHCSSPFFSSIVYGVLFQEKPRGVTSVASHDH